MGQGEGQGLSEALIDAILAKLGLSERPAPTLPGLRTVYAAWCRRVPFDNIRKMVHLGRGDPGPLPGDTAPDFFQAWIRLGAGGTCWAGNGALCTLLDALGFDAERATASMLAAPNPPPHLPPNHGSTAVRFDGRTYIVDASILHQEPLLLDEQSPPQPAPTAWSTQVSRRDGHWTLFWRPLNRPEGLECRIDRCGAHASSFREFHEKSRSWSPFNYELNVRLNRDANVIGAASGRRVIIDREGGVEQHPLAGDDRLRFLIDVIGIDEELAYALPPDVPTPPRPMER